MIIGIDASRAFLKNRTGIEEYSYRVIQNLKDKLNGHQVLLYVRKNQTVDFEIPENWKIKIINCPRLWTQIGLSWEMLWRPVDVLFIPAHTVPFIHPKKTIVTIHGLEYEFVPQGYSRWARFYMRWTIKKSCQWAKTIIAVSQNTKSDLQKSYGVDEKKVSVIYEGYAHCHPELVSGSQEMLKLVQHDRPYLLFVGRIEERKNITNIVKAFEILKEKYNVSHKLLLAGRPGHGYEKIRFQVLGSRFKEDIIELGYVTDEEKFELMRNADVFVFPTLYEGFGIPVLEAQSVGCAVVASSNSSVPEVTGCHPELVSGSLEMLKQVQHDTSTCSALLVDPQNPQEIAESIQKLLSDKAFKDGIIAKGLENVKRFSWEKCAENIAKLLH